MRYPALVITLLLFMTPVSAVAQSNLIETVSRSYANTQPELESYRVDLKTDKINEMIAKMTANMPPEMQRPSQPDLVKYWRRGHGSTVRGSGNIMPTMQQMINRFSQQFAVDLDRFFFPADQIEQRASLLNKALVKNTDTQIGSERRHNIELVFEHPATLSGAFYGDGLDLPQDGITRLEFEIDQNKMLLNQIVIESVHNPQLTVAIRHTEIKGEYFPVDIRITSPDGKIDDHFVTTLKTVDKFQLPAKQIRNVRRPGIVDVMEVKFLNYEITKTAHTE
jgi:hypothetical protein